MTDKTDSDEKCVPCEIAWNILLVLGVAAIAFMAADIFTQGQATKWVVARFESGPLASVLPIRGNVDDADAS